MFEVVLDFPAHTLDWLESTSWNTSSFDVAVTLIGSDAAYPGYINADFEEHSLNVPVEPPFLPNWEVTRNLHFNLFVV